jgi:hypothetical protein
MATISHIKLEPISKMKNEKRKEKKAVACCSMTQDNNDIIHLNWINALIETTVKGILGKVKSIEYDLFSHFFFSLIYRKPFAATIVIPLRIHLQISPTMFNRQAVNSLKGNNDHEDTPRRHFLRRRPVATGNPPHPSPAKRKLLLNFESVMV